MVPVWVNSGKSAFGAIKYRMPPPGAEGDQQKKPRFERDFIILSEFSEQVGPVPVQIIPPNGDGSFNTSHFSVRIMTSDFQYATGRFSVCEDTQLILSEKQDNAFAYVHYFCLHDIHARGFVRQYCLSYITSTFSKLADNFEGMAQHFSEVTTLLKCGNHRVFGKDLEHQLADLEHTLGMLEKEGWTGHEQVDVAQRYEGFDFSSENVPERDPQVVTHSIRETKAIMDTMKQEMAREHNLKTQLYLESQRKAYQKLQKQKGSAADGPIRREGRFTSYLPAYSANISEDGPTSTSSTSDELTASGEMSHYEPQRVMAHIVHKFERKLRSMEELSLRAYDVAMEKLREIYKLYSRTETALAVEKEECQLLDPRSSLLSIGRVPHLNTLQEFRLHVSQPSPLMEPLPYQLATKNTWAQPHQTTMSLSNQDFEEDDDDIHCSGFDTNFLEEGNALNKHPLYLDIQASYPRRRSTISDSLLGPSSLILEDDYYGNTHNTLYPLPEEQGRGEEGDFHASQTFHTPEMGPTPTLSSSEGEEERERAGRKTKERRKKGGGENVVVGLLGNSNPEFDSVKLVNGINGTQSALDSNKQANRLEVPGNADSQHGTSTKVKHLQQKARIFHRKSPPRTTNSFSINGEAGDDVFTSSQDSWELRNSHSAVAKTTTTTTTTNRQVAVRGKVPGSYHDDASSEEEISAGLGQLEESYSPKRSYINSKLSQSPLLKTHKLLDQAREKELSDLSSSYSKGVKENSVMGSVGGEHGSKRKAPSDLQISDRGWSPEFYSPVGVPSPRFSVPSGANMPSVSSVGSLTSPLSPGRSSVFSLLERPKWPPIVELRGKAKLPLVSSLDHIEGDYRFKPGRGILSLCKDNPSVRDLLYCLLHGRPLIIIGKDETLIRRLVRTLWLFVPGQSSQHQVIPWQTTPLNIKDLSRVKLMGLSSQGNGGPNWPGPHVRRYISYWDCMTGKLYTPTYNGELLRPILHRTRDRKNEEVFLSLIHSVLSDIAMRAYVYYHGHCVAQSKLTRQPSTSEASPRKFHTVAKESTKKSRSQFLQQLGVKGSDMDIIEYFVETIREQQLSEWKTQSVQNGTPQTDTDDPVTVKLYTKMCTDGYCKPRRPY